MAAAREIMWRRVMDDLSFEHARFAGGPSGPEISGTVLIAEGGTPLRVEYAIACDAQWRTRTVRLTQTHAGGRRDLRLDHDGSGGWRVDGRIVEALSGCTDVDLGVSPSTNALPINRLHLEPGATGTIRAAWVRFPSLDVVAAEQSYERLEDSSYRYRSLTSGFEAVVEVDADGLPVDYAGIWRRVADGPAAPRSAPADGFAAALLADGPSPDLGDAADDLDWLVGGWAAEVRDFDADGRVREGSGEWWFAWVLEGRALQDVWISPPPGERGRPRDPGGASDRYGTTIRRLDRQAGLWRITWINPVSGATNHLAGRRDGDRIVLLGDQDGTPIRWTLGAIRADSFIWTGESRVPGGDWVTEAEFRLRRLG